MRHVALVGWPHPPRHGRALIFEREEGEDGMASMLGAMMARDDDAETVGSEESVYEHTTESNPGMWGTVVDSKPDEEGDDGMASMLAGMMATGDEGKP